MRSELGPPERVSGENRSTDQIRSDVELTGDLDPESVAGRLVAAAGPIFARDGFEGTTVREICRHSETNVASVAYYFGDKMGLYRAVIAQIRSSREQEFPTPADDGGEPANRLYCLIHTILSRMLACDSSGWQSQLMAREMQSPTAVFRELVLDYFRPLFLGLTKAIGELVDEQTEQHRIEQLAISVVGQCLYYRVGGRVVEILIPQERRLAHFDPDSLSRHITAVTLSATKDLSGPSESSVFKLWCETSGPSSNLPSHVIKTSEDE